MDMMATTFDMAMFLSRWDCIPARQFHAVPMSTCYFHHERHPTETTPSTERASDEFRGGARSVPRTPAPPSLEAGGLTDTYRRRREASPHFWWRDEHQHQKRAGRPAGQADR